MVICGGHRECDLARSRVTRARPVTPARHARPAVGIRIMNRVRHLHAVGIRIMNRVRYPDAICVAV